MDVNFVFFCGSFWANWVFLLELRPCHREKAENFTKQKTASGLKVRVVKIENIWIVCDKYDGNKLGFS